MMLALVVDHDKSGRDALVHQLQVAQYRVAQAADPSAALATLNRERPDVVLLAWGPMAASLIAQVRARETTGRSYVLVLLDGQGSAEVPGIYAAGADDFCRRPVSREELVGRLDAPRRIRAWARAASALDWTAATDFRKLRAWRELGGLIAEDLSQLVGPLEVVGAATIQGGVQVATIPLSLPKDETEVRVSVAIEQRFLRSFGELLLGDTNARDEALADMLRELANTAGGAVKRAALTEQVTVTTGLPVTAARGPTAANDNTCCWVASLRGGEPRLAFIGEVLSKANRWVTTGDLREGMVLTQDLRNPLGALVLPAGTRLTSSTAERVVGLLGQRIKVEVACAA